MDPKAAWALRHLERFPIEVNKASLEDLLRIPGVGGIRPSDPSPAKRICLRKGEVEKDGGRHEAGQVFPDLPGKSIMEEKTWWKTPSGVRS